MTRILLVPGIGGSSPSHWQSIWQAAQPDSCFWPGLSRRDLDQPRLDRWLSAIDAAVGDAHANTIVVGHSLGCLAVAHWASSGKRRVRGALLVSPPDPEGPAFPDAASEFAPLPERPLPFATIIVASPTDPYLTLDQARRCAGSWQSELVVAEGGGHLGDDSGLGDWPFGRGLVARLAGADGTAL